MANKTHESLAAKATAHLRESAGAVGGYNGIQQEIKRQAAVLVQWASAQNLLFTDFCTDGFVKLCLDTLEHEVYRRPSDGRVIKCTKPGKFGLGHGSGGKYGRHCDATPLFYLERIVLMEQEFPTDLRLEGIALKNTDVAAAENLLPYVVTSQRFIETSDIKCAHPSEGQIETFLKKLGFTILESSCYNWIRESDGIVVTDAKMLNFIVTEEGILPIDVIIGRSVPVESD
jgi:hypothetical protein